MMSSLIWFGRTLFELKRPLASMDEWAQRHGRDPHSKKKDGWLDETEQATLFRWLSSNEKHLVVSNAARRGAPRAFQRNDARARRRRVDEGEEEGDAEEEDE